jgi:hypothetical protein
MVDAGLMRKYLRKTLSIGNFCKLTLYIGDFLQIDANSTSQNLLRVLLANVLIVK